MLHGIRELYRFSIEAISGEIGRVRDTYFDDRQWPWPLRYFVVETGEWPGGRQILLSPRSVVRADHERKVLHTMLTSARVAEATGTRAKIDRDRSDKRSRYRIADGIDKHVHAVPVGSAGSLAALTTETRDEEPGRGAPHLRSTRAVTHYYVHALDGDVGHVADFLYEETSWRIRHVVAATGSWWPGRKVLVPVGYVSWLSWDAHTLNVQVPRETIQLSPTYNAGQPPSEEYLARLAAHYASPPE